jgi:uncharacterized protein (DUF934 family)
MSSAKYSMSLSSADMTTKLSFTVSSGSGWIPSRSASMPQQNKVQDQSHFDGLMSLSGSAALAETLPADEWAPGSPLGLALQVDDEPNAEHAQAQLITINFDSFSDGRGLSLAVLLRTRFGFDGELRAIGDVHPDLLHYMRRCGFTSYVLPEHRQLPSADNRDPLVPYSDHYQGSVTNPEPAFRRVCRGQ